MANRDFTSRDLTGFNVYHNHENKQTIYYDIFTKTGYIITNQYLSSFSSWQTRLPISIVVAAIMILFGSNPLISILWGVVIYTASTVLFHLTYLKKLPVNKNFVRPKSKGFFKEIASRYPLPILRIITIVFFLLAIVMIANQLITGNSNGEEKVTYVFVTISLICGLLIAYVMYIKKKENL